MIRVILKGFMLFVIALLLAMTIRTFSLKSLQRAAVQNFPVQKDTAALRNLSGMVQFKTISYEDSPNGQNKLAELERFYQYMYKTWPLVFSSADIQKINASLLITFIGSNASLKPALFLAHLDVVPADENAGWTHPPFAGYFASDTIYGRGVLDDKGTVAAMLTALERRLKRGFKPKRTLMLALGQDEETGGHAGAAAIARYLSKHNIRAEFICDEGFGIMENMVPGIQKPAALIGIAEKGFLSLKIRVHMEGGHSSMPKKTNATSVLTEALERIDHTDYLESVSEPQKHFFRHLAPECSFFYRFLFANLWVTEPAVKGVMNLNEKSFATIHTTHVTTVLRAGDKDNVLPSSAEGIVNFRILPGQTIEDILEKTRNLLKDLPVETELSKDRKDPSPVSADQGASWELISNSIREVFPGVIVAPALVITGTDSKNYTAISDRIYRFIPFRYNHVNLSGMHGVNERLAANSLYEAIAYYENIFGKL